MKELDNNTITKELIAIFIFSFIISVAVVVGFFMLL